MCGIFGELAVDAGTPADAFARSADRALAHRGPDGAGTVRTGPCLLGHRRLAILDLDPRAAQPMWSSDRRVALVFNGEIYNYLELREETPAPPGGWRTTGDTEVLVERWAHRGLVALDDAIGMFAFAAWDDAARRLWLVRDRLGKKPLYWAVTRRGHLRFASELPALLVDDEVPRETTADRLAEFLQYGFIAAPRCGLSSVHVVPQGCALEAWVEGGVVRTRVHRYWALPSPEPAARHDDWLEAFRATLVDAVRIRLRADVPLGAFLSGGVDSSVVALLAARASGATPLRTYTADFDDPASSEAAWAREVAEHIEAVHTELRVAPPPEALAAAVVDVWGDLHGDPSAIPTMALTQQMRTHVTVALSGDGGDELLGGYTRYRLALDAHARYGRLPFFTDALLGALRRRTPTWLRGTTRLARLQRSLARAYPAELRAYATREWPPVVRAGPAWNDPVVASLARHAHRAPLLQLMACDIENYLPEDNLVKVDRASMAVGLEVRSPLLDHRLFELVMAARPEWLFDEQGAKRPLRELFAPELPSAVFTRKKMGFAPPIAAWLRKLPASALLGQLERSGLREALEWREVTRQVRLYARGVHGFAGRVWYMLVAAEWWNRWKPSLR
jgi:asparagine synthase (glutamine-hydrolysing)